jgi:hypothetical protein
VTARSIGLCLAPLLCVFSTACEGVLGDAERDGEQAGSPAGPNGQAQPQGNYEDTPKDCNVDSGPSVLRRLSKLEYRLSLQQLLQIPTALALESIPDDAEEDGFNTIAALQAVSDGHLRGYLETAEDLGAALMQDSVRRAAVLGCEPSAAGCLESFVTAFGKLAYRRPLTSEESANLASRAIAAGIDTEDQFNFVIEALLTSPSFVFRVEVGDNTPLAPLTALELASRLSFTLWGRGPTAELLAKAEAGGLDTDEDLASTAQSMLGDARAHELFGDFFRQWLDFSDLRAPKVPPVGWSDALLSDMQGETDVLLSDVAWTPGASFLTALTANHTYVTPALSTLYGLPAAGDGFQRVEFSADSPRANTGLLTHPSLISPKTDGDLIAKRGKWIRSAFFCEHLEPPPGTFDQVAMSLAGLTYPQVLAHRNTEEPCASCHARIDPVGVGFAHFDAVGLFDPNIDVAAFGLPQRLDGVEPAEYASLAELATKIAEAPEVSACMAERLFTYTQGRTPDAVDQCTLDAAGQRFASEGHQFQSLALALVESPSFRQRRAPVTP